MSEGVIIAIITSATSILLSLITLSQNLLQKRQAKKSGTEARLERIEEKLDRQDVRMGKMEQHNDLQYLSLLRLTVMDSDMPMSERLMAGREYLARGGNGDVKAFYETLEHSVNGKG